MSNCHDCKKEIEIKDKEIKNGVQLKYHDKETDKDILVYKCHECYKRNPALNNFRECEVYSRVVGYITPVKQWHEGKQQEFEDRKTFEMTK